MKNKFFKLFLKFNFMFICIIPFFNAKTVYASTTFTTCTVSEASYLRATPGGSILKDVDNSQVLIYEPKRLEVIETRTVDGVEYKKLRTNYYSNNYEGWIKSAWLKDFKTYTTDDSYAQKLRDKHFPESYVLPLVKLHAIYPNWNFEVSKTNLEWSTAINGEYSPVYKNLLCSSNLSAIKPLLSTDGASYNAGEYNQFEPNCYAPSKQTISFYMDPRNWFYDNTIFMFEQLSYNSNLHTSNAVQPILNGTFMAGSYLYNGQTWTYANTFVEVGKVRNVSPIQLASRVVQEQGASGSATINMKDGDQTYYNHFNINAFGSTTEIIVANALKTAKNNGWTSPYLSILGGSSVISNGYTSVGQDTNYYQKFNTINTNNLYWNQYMANVRVLPSESNSIYTSYYKSNILNSSFTFKIPVYNNMPDATTLSTSSNGDNTLRSLSVSGCNLNPSFNSAATEYTCSVPSSTKQVTVTAIKTSLYSILSGDGVVVLNDNSTEVNIVVTAANEETKTYKITINKVEESKESPADIISYLEYNNSNNVITGITIGTDRSNIISKVKNKYTLATINIKDKNGNVKTNGIVSTGDQITITNGGQTVTFTSVVKGDVNGDGKISISDYAKVKSHILGSSTMSGAYLKAADANGDEKISISDYAKIKSHILGTSQITK